MYTKGLYHQNRHLLLRHERQTLPGSLHPATPGFELTGIVERNNSESRERYPNSKLYRSVEELCADKDIQLVIVNTPTHLHYAQVKLALESGKHVMVEKPFTTKVKKRKNWRHWQKRKGCR